MCPLDPRFVANMPNCISHLIDKQSKPHAWKQDGEREYEWARDRQNGGKAGGRQSQENNFEAWRGRARERNKRQTERDSMTKNRVLRGTHTHTQPPTFPVLQSGFIVRVHVAAVTQTNKNTSKQLRNLFARVRAHKRWLNDCGRDGDDGRVEPNAFLCDKNSSGIRLSSRYGRRSFVKHSEWKSPALPSDKNMGREE